MKNSLPKLIKSKINNWLIFGFFVEIFIIKLPSFYYLLIPSKLYTSHSLSKIIIGLIFIVYFFINYKIIKSFIKEKKTVFILFLLFFLSQSLSIIKTIDIFLFWKIYHNLIISAFIFFLSFFIAKFNKVNLKSFLIFTGLIVIFLELFFLISPNFFLNFFSNIIQKEILDAYITNISRSRFSLDLNVELFLPIFLGYAFYYKDKNNFKNFFIFFALSLTILFLSIFSNFRTRIICSFFSIIVFFLIYFKNYSKEYTLRPTRVLFNFFSFILIFFIITKLTIEFSNYKFGFNVIDRLLLNKEIESAGSINYRINSILTSFEILKSYPLTGIGLGNFIYFNPQGSKLNYSLVINKSEKDYYNLVLYSPHNILAQTMSESGLIGFISFIILIGYLIIKDTIFLFHSFNKKNNIIFLSLIVASWEIFLYAFFNPASSIFIIGWFWFLRGFLLNLI